MSDVYPAARTVPDSALRTLADALQASSLIGTRGTWPTGCTILTLPVEREEGYSPGEIVLDIADMETEVTRMGDYETEVLQASGGTYPSGAQTVDVIQTRRIHLLIRHRCVAQTLHGLLDMKGRLDAFYGEQDNVSGAAGEVSRDMFRIKLYDYHRTDVAHPVEVTNMFIRWRFNEDTTKWNTVEVPREQLLNGLYEQHVFVDVRFLKTYQQIQKHTEIIDLQAPPFTP